MNPVVAAKLASSGKSILTNKWTWIFIAVVIVMIVLAINWKRIKARFDKDYGNYTDGLPNDISSDRKEYLEGLGQKLYTAMGTIDVTSIIDPRVALFKEAASLTDGELKYLALYFRRAITRGESLWMWVDDEWMPGTDTDEQLMARLAEIGEK